MGDTSQQCTSLSKASASTVGLAVDLAGATLQNSPQMLKSILEDKGFQKAVAEALKSAGQAIMDDQAKGKPVSDADTLSRLGAAGGKAALDKGKGIAIQQLKKSPEFQRLEQSLKDLGCAFDATPVGVFVNENKTLLIIVGAVGALGGAVALYYTKTGDIVGENAAKLLSGMKVTKIGGVELKANKVEFKPSERKVTLELGAAGKWDGVKADFALGASFKNDQLAGINGQGSVIVDVAPRWSLSASGSGSWARGDAGKPDSVKAISAVGMKYKLTERANLSFQVMSTFSQDPTARKGGGGGGIDLEVKDPFGPKTGLRVGVDGQKGIIQQGVPGGFGPTRPDDRINLKVQLTF